jgi:hypothetical protein
MQINNNLQGRISVRMIFAAAVAVVAGGFGLQPAKAYTAPWCAVINLGTATAYWDCRYGSIEQCQPNVLAGNRGWCNPNPYFVASYQPVERQHHRKH